jgi:DNA-binding transcriptional LysR family regulator
MSPISIDPPTSDERAADVSPGQKSAIELRHLRYFLAVYEELHFGRAAARLHMAQPPLSQAIRKLEDALGVKLFDRTSRSVTPTDAGHSLAEGARRVFSSFDLALASARNAGDAALTLRIGCVPELPIQRLLLFLASLQARVHDASAQVTHLASVEQLQHLRAGGLDLAIFHHADEYDDIETEPLFPGEPLMILLPPDHKLVDRPVVRSEDLSDEALVTYPRIVNPTLYDRVLALFDDRGYRFSTIRETDGSNPRDLMLAVASGSGVALVPASVTELSETGGIAIRRPIDPPLTMPDTVIAWPVNPPRLPPPLVDTVRDLARGLRQSTDGDAPRSSRA